MINNHTRNYHDIINLSITHVILIGKSRKISLGININAKKFRFIF